ncbi:unnamed protein product [Rotaria socialis]
MMMLTKLLQLCIRIGTSEPDLHPTYNLHNWNRTDRNHFNAFTNDQDLVEAGLPPFETCIRDAQAPCIMCILNEISGIPACADQFFIDNFALVTLQDRSEPRIRAGISYDFHLLSTCENPLMITQRWIIFSLIININVNVFMKTLIFHITELGFSKETLSTIINQLTDLNS